jgi:hypothetical protein
VLSPTARKQIIPGVLFAAVLVVAGPATAQERAIQVGGVIGPNFSQLNGPDDPEGEVTVLAGTAFTGAGVTGGATGAIELFDLPGGVLFGEVDLLYSHHSGTGFAESRTTGDRRELTLKADVLRIPFLPRYDLAFGALSLRAKLGPELLIGFSSGHVTREYGVEPPPQETFETRATTHLGFTGTLGAAYELSSIRIPLDLRFTWDPMVPKSTQDRFSGYESFSAPGEYRVAYNYQFMAVAGVEFDLAR